VHFESRLSKLGALLKKEASFFQSEAREATRSAEKEPSSTDGRRQLLALTRQGREEFAKIDSASAAEIGLCWASSPGRSGNGWSGRWGTIEELLGGGTEPRVSYLLRPHKPGDIGWVVSTKSPITASATI
jgi:hypothetical protein